TPNTSTALASVGTVSVRSASMSSSDRSPIVRSVLEAEARARDELDRSAVVVGVLVVHREDAAVVEQRRARIPDVLEDAGVVVVIRRHTALANRELVGDVPRDAIFGDAAAHAVRRAPVAVDHEDAA